MGNSLLDINVFGRRTGIRAAQFAKNRGEVKGLNLRHLERYLRELDKLGIKSNKKAPIILPDYRSPDKIKT